MPEHVSPWRGPGPGRPALPLPPERMPSWRGGRPLKRWTWVGAFGPELMLCAAVARIGPATAAWWAVWDRGSGEFRERSLRRTGGLEVTPARVLVPDVMALTIGDGEPVEVVSRHGAQHIWTRKRGGVRVRGRVGDREVDLRGLVDESAGYHARRTAWLWSAGVGTLAGGEAVAWNLVDGLHDAPVDSERTVWVEGEPREVPPQRFDGLSGVGDLRFGAEATRARRERLLIMSSDYEQPFGSFTGTLPHAGALREGWGVMERHAVAW